MVFRIDIKVGYECNNWCRFCAQAHNRNQGHLETNKILEALIVGKKQGAKEVVFTGGECTIRNDILYLIDYAKKLGYEYIQLQTNGRRFSDLDFLKKCINLGISEFGCSLHGHIPEIHDYLTRAPGSWKQTVQGLINIKKLGGKIILNSVIVKPNYRYALEFAKLMTSLNVDQFQYAFVHATGNALINYKSIMPTMSEAVQYMKKGTKYARIHNINVMNEAIPFCLMQGYERFVSELYIPSSMIKEKDRFVWNFEKVRKNEGKTLFPQCLNCRFRLICEGPWIEYPMHFGIDEFKPVPGKLINSKEDILNNTYEFPLIPGEQK